MLGGTMFEYFYQKERLSDFNEFLNSFNIDWVELSRGSIDIDDDIYFSLVKEYSSDFTVLSEVGPNQLLFQTIRPMMNGLFSSILEMVRPKLFLKHVNQVVRYCGRWAN